MLGGSAKEASPLSGTPHQPGRDAAPVVQAEGLTKRFGNFTAADQISFRIGRGEIFGLLGPNGAGKSTTFKMMCGLLRPTAGRARVAGLDLYQAAGAARARVGYMAQKFSLYGDLSVRQNLNFFAGVYGLARARRREQLERMTTAFRLGPYLDSNAGELPLGFKQRLALACAVMHDPAVLFLDEPTSGVDPLTRREFWSHGQKLGSEYLTYILWAISPEGRAVNLGEVLLGGNDRSKVKVTTDLQAFALIVTAEPYYAVREPSNVVVLENVIRKDTKGTTEDSKCEVRTDGAGRLHSHRLQVRSGGSECQVAVGILRSAQCVAHRTSPREPSSMPATAISTPSS